MTLTSRHLIVFAIAALGMLSFPFLALAQDFVPLTSIPGIQEAASANSIGTFLNSLYRLCIGAAAVIAVLKIIQGGITYMMGDSITEKRDAKHNISMAIFGLVLVLSPYLVFSIIDPRILRLDVDLSTLAPPPITEQTGDVPGTPGTDTTSPQPEGEPEPPTSDEEGDPENEPVPPPPSASVTGSWSGSTGDILWAGWVPNYPVQGKPTNLWFYVTYSSQRGTEVARAACQRDTNHGSSRGVPTGPSSLNCVRIGSVTSGTFLVPSPALEYQTGFSSVNVP
jgi:Type IV secretion system pilin